MNSFSRRRFLFASSLAAATGSVEVGEQWGFLIRLSLWSKEEILRGQELDAFLSVLRNGLDHRFVGFVLC